LSTIFSFFLSFSLGGIFLRWITKENQRADRRPERWRLHCSLCGQEIAESEEYWFCNGFSVCADCLPEFARQELAPCRLLRGKEAAT
jgi:hypothetical protein